MQENGKLQLFEDQPIRTAWDEENEEWYFLVVDVVSVLTESADYTTGRKYWNKLKQRMKNEGNELVTNCHQLKRKIYAIIGVHLSWLLICLQKLQRQSLQRFRTRRG